jgi:hypothetical protein
MNDRQLLRYVCVLGLIADLREGQGVHGIAWPDGAIEHRLVWIG